MILRKFVRSSGGKGKLMLFPFKSLLVAFLLLSSLDTITAQTLKVPPTLAFSAIAQNTSNLRKLPIQNDSSEKLIIEKLVINGKYASWFHLQSAVSFPWTIAPHEEKFLEFVFSPKAVEKMTVIEADLTLITNQGTSKITLSGLTTLKAEGDNEPPLQLIAEMLGYSIDIGSDKLTFGMQDTKLGSEVEAALFDTADPSQPVMMKAVARYSPQAIVPFGYYYRNKRDQLRYVKTGTLSGSDSQYQTLFPELASGSDNFKPTDIPFGLFVSLNEGALYSEDKLNEKKHAIRIYPLIDQTDQPIPDSFLFCIEEASNGDFQDYVFVLSNVKIHQQL